MYIYIGAFMNLTTKQQHLFDYLQKRLAQTGKTPSLRQVAADLGVSHNAVAQLFGQLEKKGIIERTGRYSRTVRLVPPDQKKPATPRGRELPIIGQITAGLPMYAQQEWDGSVVVDDRMFHGENLFCLRIMGDSMCEAGILDGDLVICEPRQYAEDGEIVAVLIQNEEATVKRFYRGQDCLELHPANRHYQVVRYRFNELLVQGKVVGVIRGENALFSQ